MKSKRKFSKLINDSNDYNEEISYTLLFLF